MVGREEIVESQRKRKEELRSENRKWKEHWRGEFVYVRLKLSK